MGYIIMKKILLALCLMASMNTKAQTIHYEGQYAVAAIQPICDNYDSRVKILPNLSISNGVVSAFVNWSTEVKISQTDTGKWVQIDFGGFSASLPDTLIAHVLIYKAFLYVADSTALTNITYLKK